VSCCLPSFFVVRSYVVLSSIRCPHSLRTVYCTVVPYYCTLIRSVQLESIGIVCKAAYISHVGESFGSIKYRAPI
jgi:hypothetical protein